ncbi:MAG: MBL fold metallo-hydrolase [Promethearchaeota archaeon]
MVYLVIINSEGKFDENYYLIDGLTMGMQKFLSIYIIENNGMRLMIDVGEALKSRKIINKLKEFGLYPIHKIVLTHSHWDHAQGISKLINSMKDCEVEVLAADNAIDNLRNPEKMLKGFENFSEGYPFEGVTPLKEGDIIDINGLELEVMNFFGHTLDSIALLDKQNRNIFAGDAIIFRVDQGAFFVPIMPPDFHEERLLETFNKLRNLESDLNSISLSHFGVWKDNHFDQIVNEMEDLYFEAKNSVIKWYNENPSIDYIVSNYCKNFASKSEIWTEKLFVFLISMMIDGLKFSGFLKK